MREQRAAARHLPLEPVAKRTCIDRDQNQTGRAREMLRRGFGHLVSGGEVNKAVAQIDRAAGKPPFGFGLAPRAPLADLVDRFHRTP